jgi:hypothetical protein
MGKLREPSSQLANKILTEVGFEDRLNGFILRERSGPMPITLYSFMEVVSFLNEPHPRIDFIELEGWVRKTMSDEELADRIAKTIKSRQSDQERSLRIKKVMQERLCQCKTFIR